MAITMIDPYNVIQQPFEHSHLLAKLQKMVVAARIFRGVDERSSVIHSVGHFDLSDDHIYKAVREDYEYVREIIQEKGFQALSGKMGTHVQPRTKGPGHGSTSRAFYARTHFVAHIIGLTS